MLCSKSSNDQTSNHFFCLLKTTLFRTAGFNVCHHSWTFQGTAHKITWILTQGKCLLQVFSSSILIFWGAEGKTNTEIHIKEPSKVIHNMLHLKPWVSLYWSLQPKKQNKNTGIQYYITLKFQ